MKLMPGFRRILRAGRRDIAHEVQDEIQSHLELEVSRLVGEGVPEAEAWQRARARFGDEELISGECRRVQRQHETRSGWREVLDSIRQDLQIGARSMLNHPGFTLVVVLTLALGIGANTATFSFANALLGHRLPVLNPDELVRMYVSWEDGSQFASWAYPDYFDVRERNDVFTGVVAESQRPVHLSEKGRSERAWAWVVSGDYFDLLGVEPVLGRKFLPEEDQVPDAHPVILLSHSFWTRRFAADPDILGRSVTLNAHEFVVVGVTPEGFNGTLVGFRPDVFVPTMMMGVLSPGENALEARGSHGITHLLGRLEPGVSVAQARASIVALMKEIEAENPDTNTGNRPEVMPELAGRPHPRVRQGIVGFLSLMFAVVGFVLLLGCANVAGLSLARSAARAKEIGVRMSIGARRGRLVRQLLVESLLLAAVAGVAGLLLSWWLIELVGAFRPETGLPFDWDIGLDSRVLGFTAAVSLLTGLLFGLAPAVHATRPDLVAVLKEGPVGPGAGSSLARRAMVVLQVALSLVLLIGAGMVLRSLRNAADIDLGFEPEGQAIAELDLELQGYDAEVRREYRRRLLPAIEALPGVRAVGLGWQRPLTLGNSTSAVLPEGHEVPEGSNWPDMRINFVSPGYFDAMGIPIVRGRRFTQGDDADGAPVMIINQTFAERFWPGDDPIGKRVQAGGREHLVVGVVPTGKYFSLGEAPTPVYYRPMDQGWDGIIHVHVRTDGDAAALLAALGRTIRDLDPALPVIGLQTMDDGLGMALLPARLAASVVSAFAALALMLAAMGLYGVIAFSVSRGVHDIGVRMALGAGAREVVSMVVREGMGLTAVGLALGLAGGLAGSRLLASLLHGVSTIDGPSFGVAAVALAVVALGASLVPARQATRIDPVAALRQE